MKYGGTVVGGGAEIIGTKITNANERGASIVQDMEGRASVLDGCLSAMGNEQVA